MAVSIAEYLGQRTDVDQQIVPVAKGTQIQCPFMDRTCDKASKVKNPTPPVCSVRKPDGTVWIVCEHRLCSTRQKKTVIVNGRKKQIENILVEHQRDILRKVAKLIYQDLKWFTEFGHLNRGDMLTSEQHRCHNEKKKFQRRV